MNIFLKENSISTECTVLSLRLRPLKRHCSCFQKIRAQALASIFPLHFCLILVENNETDFQRYLVILKCFILITVVLSICTVFSSDFFFMSVVRLKCEYLSYQVRSLLQHVGRGKQMKQKQNISAITVHIFTLRPALTKDGLVIFHFSVICTS